jgi:HAMP domain-containing protein
MSRQAKRNYTLKKNALTRLLDPIPALLPDHGVSKLKLEEARKRCIVAWDALSTAYQELADVQSEDEAEDPEQEGRDAEFGNLEGRYHSMVDSLAETVLQRESQAETNRLQNEKNEFVAVRRLHIANLYNEIKDTMTQL